MKIKSILLLITVLSLSACSKVRNTRSLKLAHGLDVTHPVHKGMVFMAEQVEKKSGGKLKVEIYPSQQLGTERQATELLQIGSLAMTKVSGAVLESFAPNLKVMSLPYIFRDKDHKYQAFDGEVGKELLLQSQDFWLRGLCFYDAGSRSFYSKEKPIMQPADLDGMKIRVQESETAMNMVRSLGGSPTPISWGELYTALQQGVVDGAENNPPSFYTSRHYEICKYYSINEHTAVPDVLIISTVVWNNLSDQEQQWLQEAVDESVIYQRQLWAEAEQEALNAVKVAGVEISYPDKTPFMNKLNSMFEDYRDNEELYSFIQRIQAIGKE